MKSQLPENFIEWCFWCKDEILSEQGYVYTKKGQYYHLDCYHEMNNIPLELEEEDFNSLEDNNESEE